MGILKKADQETTNLMLDDTDFVTVRKGISKGDFNKLLGLMPGNVGDSAAPTLTIPQATAFQTSLFEHLVVGWSLVTDPTVEEYLALDADGANAIDAALADHFGKLLPSDAEGK